MAARIEGEAAMELQYPRVLFTRGREGSNGRLLGEANNLIIAFCLTITDIGFSFIEMTDLTLNILTESI